MGEVVSEVLRQALTAPQAYAGGEPKAVHGFKPFPLRGGIVTNELVDQLRHDDAQ